MTVKELRDILNNFSEHMADITIVAVNKGYLHNDTIDVLGVHLIESQDLESRQQIKKLLIRLD